MMKNIVQVKCIKSDKDGDLIVGKKYEFFCNVVDLLLIRDETGEQIYYSAHYFEKDNQGFVKFYHEKI